MTRMYEAAQGSDGSACWWEPVVMPLVFVSVACAAGHVEGVR